VDDKTNLLVQRLRRNVIRVGLKRISLAYSSIALSDVRVARFPNQAAH